MWRSGWWRCSMGGGSLESGGSASSPWQRPLAPVGEDTFVCVLKAVGRGASTSGGQSRAFLSSVTKADRKSRGGVGVERGGCLSNAACMKGNVLRFVATCDRAP